MKRNSKHLESPRDRKVFKNLVEIWLWRLQSHSYRNSNFRSGQNLVGLSRDLNWAGITYFDQKSAELQKNIKKSYEILRNLIQRDFP